MRFDGLLPKTLLILIGLFGMTTLVMAGFQSWTIDHTLTTEFRRNGKDIAESIASFSIDFVVNQDPTAIQSMIDERRDGIPGISYILVLDEQGNAIAHTFVPSVPDEALRLAGNPLSTTFHQIRVKGLGDAIDVCSAILAGQGGYVHVGMDREPIRIKIWHRIWQMAGLMTLLFFISAGTTAALLRKVTLPLRQLTESAQRLAFGEALRTGESPTLTSRFPDHSGNDEVAELASAFRRMANEVSARETGLKELFKLVLDSTAEGIYGVDLEGNCTFCNSACVKLLGYERPEDLLGHNMHNCMHHTRRNGSPYPQSDCFIYLAARNGNATHADDEVYWRADGSSFPVEIWSNPMRKDGQIAGCVVSFLDITVRKNAQEELNRFFNLMPSMMIVAGFDGYVKRVNPTVLDLGGWSSIEDVQAEPFLNYFHPDDREFVASKVQRLVGGSVIETFEARSRYHVDSYKWFSWSAAAYSDRQVIFAIGQDVTARRQNEEALRDREEIIRVISESAPNAILLMGPDEKIDHWNPAAASIFGYTSEEVLGKNLHETLVPLELRERYRSGLELFHQTGAGPAIGKTLELEAVHKDGHRFPVEVSLNSVSIKGQWNAVGVIRDITERKLAEDSLRLNVAAMEAAANGIAISDVHGTLEWINPAFTTLTGYSAAEAIGQNPRVLKSEQQTPEFYVQMWKSIIAGQIWHGELVNKRKDGSLYDEEMTITPVRDATGHIMHFVAIKQDISERKQAQQQLHQAKASAEDANRAKSEFLANMSHEIRTPMNGIIGLTGLALDTELVPEQRQYLEGVMLSAEALLKLINSILDFSKIEAGKLELERTAFDLRDTLENAIKTLAQRAFEKRLELLFEVRPDVPDALIGDPTRLWQIIINLVGNALKFTLKGEITVLVELESQDDDAANLRFTVSDTGVGIPADKQAKLFQPFVQADNSTTRKYGGTGLGLVISARLVEMMGGRAWFESEEGRGSQFHFTARFDRQPAHSTKAPPPHPVDIAGLRVLIVDDNATNRRIQRDQLTHWGMVPIEVESGPAALEILQTAIDARQPFDLMLLDVMMPEMDGFTVLERIRAMGGMDRPVILMLSSACQKGEAARAHELGAAAYLLKPIRPTELLGAIQTARGLASEQAMKHRKSAPTKLVETRGDPLHILVAEDNAVNQLLARRTLEKAGHSVVVAKDGEEAVAALGCDTFDLVLMDVQMPVMDGFQATAHIRAQEIESGKHQQIVAMTAHALKGDRERCLAAGMDGYVTKPIRNSELFAAIATAVKDANTFQTSRVASAPGLDGVPN